MSHGPIVVLDMISGAGGTAELQAAVEQTRGLASATNSHLLHKAWCRQDWQRYRRQWSRPGAVSASNSPPDMMCDAGQTGRDADSSGADWGPASATNRHP